MITCTCGHMVKSLSETRFASVKSQSRTGKNAVSYQTVCKICYNDYLKHDMLLQSDDEIAEYLSLDTVEWV